MAVSQRPFKSPETAERARRIFELKRDNPRMGFRALGKAVGISGPSAHKLYHKVMDHILAETIEDGVHVRAMEMSRLDDLYAEARSRIGRGVTLTDDGERWYPDADNDLRAIRECLRISESRRKMAGTDAPEKFDIDATVRSIGAEVTSMPDEELDKELEGVTAAVPPHEGRRRRQPSRREAAKPKQSAKARGVARPQEQKAQTEAPPVRGESPT